MVRPQGFCVFFLWTAFFLTFGSGNGEADNKGVASQAETGPGSTTGHTGSSRTRRHLYGYGGHDCALTGERCHGHNYCCSGHCSYSEHICIPPFHKGRGGMNRYRPDRFGGGQWDCKSDHADCTRHFDCCSHDCSWKSFKCLPR